ncbi:MAG: hypothetical protein WC657_06870 [Candidatus Paceibacterota bacterium]|jgi:hypothetical protein
MKRGQNRYVFLAGPLAVKVPKPCSAWAFASGVLSNILERDRWRANQHPQMARVLWCAPGGVALVMRRYRQTPVNVSHSECGALPFCGVDEKPSNFALDECGRIVLLDYGNNDWGVKAVPQ